MYFVTWVKNGDVTEYREGFQTYAIGQCSLAFEQEGTQPLLLWRLIRRNISFSYPLKLVLWTYMFSYPIPWFTLKPIKDVYTFYYFSVWFTNISHPAWSRMKRRMGTIEFVLGFTVSTQKVVWCSFNFHETCHRNVDSIVTGTCSLSYDNDGLTTFW